MILSVHHYNLIMSIIIFYIWVFTYMYMFVYEYVRLVTFEGLVRLHDIYMYSITFIRIGMQMVNSC